MEVEVLTDEPYLFSGLYDRAKHPAPGIAGGHDGAVGQLSMNNGLDVQPKLSVMLPADTVFTLEMPGGGGFGPPLERSPDKVLADVRAGYVSVEAARKDYGVVIDDERWVVDVERTAAARRAAVSA
jgi:N-methylhydantoinase B